MKKNLLFGFIFAFICWVVVIGVYKFVDQKPAHTKEAPTTAESEEEIISAISPTAYLQGN